ncbi:MAG: hypothetical protein QGG50_07045 [Methanopyri archaeon]|jgi:aspartokinase|nr:hypothetical protein [Methanopyri archaeon]
MVTVSHIVKSIINARPRLQEAIMEGIVNYSSLAEKLRPRIEAELGKKVKNTAIIMALRRHGERLNKGTILQKPITWSNEIIMKTNLCDVCIVKAPSALARIEQIHRVVNYEKGETLNIIQGNYEITIVISQKHLDELRTILKDETVLNIEKDLVAITLSLGEEFLHTPGILSLVTRRLAWENVNIFENISTMTELTYIIGEKDAVKAYSAFQEMIREHFSEEREKYRISYRT